MRTGIPKVDLLLSDEERSQLQSFARSRSLPAALSNRARIVLSSAEGEPNNAIAERLMLTKATVGKWRTRFIERRIAGLYDEVRPGKPRTIDDERVAHLIKTTLHTKPVNGSTHWSVRTVAAETGISKSSVARYFQLFGLQPHRTEGFKLSNDPFFIEKLRDVVGLYLSPPDNALVICVNEKSQCQALERTQPMLPMDFGYVEGVTDEACDDRGFVKTCRQIGVMPHMARNLNLSARSAIKRRSTRHAGYVVGQRNSKYIDQCFSRGKVIGPIRQLIVQGLDKLARPLTLTTAAQKPEATADLDATAPAVRPMNAEKAEQRPQNAPIRAL